MDNLLIKSPEPFSTVQEVPLLITVLTKMPWASK